MSGDTTLDIKAVPGARRDQVVGWLGERLKVRISAPPEGGRANDAICRLIARELGLRPGDVAIVRGHAQPEKTLRISAEGMALIRARWPRREGPQP